jgi:hypothetical protein
MNVSGIESDGRFGAFNAQPARPKKHTVAEIASSRSTDLA